MQPRRLHPTKRTWEYQLPNGVCAACALRRQCTRAANSRTVLQRALRDHGGKSDMSRVENAVAWLSNRLRALEIAATVDDLRGIEEAKNWRAQISRAMVPSQIAEAQRLAREWLSIFS